MNPPLNPQLANATRSAAFHLTLSDNLINTLLELERDREAWGHSGFIYHRGTSGALERRGLIVAAKDPEREDLPATANGFYFDITPAGELVIQLLKMAGFQTPPFPWGPDVFRPPRKSNRPPLR